MSEVKIKKERKRMSRSAIVLIVGLIIIAIPIIIFGAILGIAAMQTGTPREGSRFDNDLDPAITQENVTALKEDLAKIGSVEDVEVILSEGQLRIFIDTNDSLSEEQVDTIVTTAYNKVNSMLPINKYFTATSAKKMYDLQINVFTTAEASDIGSANSRQYKLLHKNSAEETYGIDDLAHPKDPALAAELEGITVEVTTPVEGTEEPETEIDDNAA
ncbi:MAG: hypothetical protein IK151_09325 [Erysipelotrichaceae bacterium]|nr:hypothetical protein [Erysipelotrichaceae bacterium]